jgi:HEAT repeat protein
MRRGARSWIAGAAALAAGCGGDPPPASPPLPFDKVTPTLPRTWSGLPLAAWVARATDADPSTRATAAWGIAELAGDAAAVEPALRPLLRDASPAVRWAALHAVRRLGSGGASTAEAVVERIAAAETPAIRALAREAAAAIGAPAVPALARALGSPEAVVRWGALQALRAVGDPAAGAAAAVDGLAAGDPDPAVRAAALQALARLGAEGLRLAVLRFEAGDFTVQPDAARAIAFAGPRGVEALRAILASPRDEQAAQAAAALADLGPGAGAALPELLAALGRSGTVRANAAEALVAIGEEAVPGLVKVAGGTDAAAAEAARYALERIGAGR